MAAALSLEPEARPSVAQMQESADAQVRAITARREQQKEAERRGELQAEGGQARRLQGDRPRLLLSP